MNYYKELNRAGAFRVDATTGKTFEQQKESEVDQALLAEVVRHAGLEQVLAWLHAEATLPRCANLIDMARDELTWQRVTAERTAEWKANHAHD